MHPCIPFAMYTMIPRWAMASAAVGTSIWNLASNILRHRALRLIFFCPNCPLSFYSSKPLRLFYVNESFFHCWSHCVDKHKSCMVLCIPHKLHHHYYYWPAVACSGWQSGLFKQTLKQTKNTAHDKPKNVTTGGLGFWDLAASVTGSSTATQKKVIPAAFHSLIVCRFTSTKGNWILRISVPCLTQGHHLRFYSISSLEVMFTDSIISSSSGFQLVSCPFHFTLAWCLQ